MMKRAGLSFRAKDTNVIILSRIVEMSSSWRSNIAGYAAKGFVRCCLPHISAIIEADFGVRRGGGGSIGCPLSVLGWSCEVAGVWWVSPLEAGRGLFRLAPTGSLLPHLLLWQVCGGVLGLLALRLPLSWPLRYLVGFR